MVIIREKLTKRGIVKDTQIIFTLGFCGICAVISAVSFLGFHNNAIGWLFLIVAVGVVVLSISKGRRGGA